MTPRKDAWRSPKVPRGRPKGALGPETPRIRAAVLAGHREGMTQREIAESLGRTRAAISLHAKTLGLKFITGYHGQRRVRDASLSPISPTFTGQSLLGWD